MYLPEKMEIIKSKLSPTHYLHLCFMKQTTKEGRVNYSLDFISSLERVQRHFISSQEGEGEEASSAT